MSPAWKAEAEHLREVLRLVGVDSPWCLPGEVDECGADYAHHCMGYLAALKAKADVALWHMHHGEPAGQHAADGLYEHWSRVFAAEADHAPDPGACHRRPLR